MLSIYGRLGSVQTSELLLKVRLHLPCLDSTQDTFPLPAGTSYMGSRATAVVHAQKTLLEVDADMQKTKYSTLQSALAPCSLLFAQLTESHLYQILTVY